MSTPKRCDVVPLFPEDDDSSVLAGWDPYIFSILADRNRSYADERRRVPRPLNTARRRALLLSAGHKRKR